VATRDDMGVGSMAEGDRARAHSVREGRLRGGLPYLALGRGPALVVLPGLEPEHVNPTGLARRWELKRRGPLAEHFTVYVVRRPPGLPLGCTMSDLAALHAEALREELGGGAFALIGESTGGSIGLQLAVDHPGLVRRLVLISSACRLSEPGRAVQRKQATWTTAGRPRRALAATAPALAASAPGARALRILLWLVAPVQSPRDPADLLRMIAAEDAFDVEPDLARVTAPTLVIGGDRDGYYSVDLFRRTARGVAEGTLRIYPGTGHGASISRRATEDALAFLLADSRPRG
jgi:pimeloyl-ACP methyl ester carboxylesterase